MRRRLLATLLSLCALQTLPSSHETASASCAAPYLDLDRDVLSRGVEVTVEGRAFVDGCQDSKGCTAGVGCGSCQPDEPAPVPMHDVTLLLVQGERTWRLDTADAAAARNGHAGWIAWEFTAPRDAEPGRAELVPDHGEASVILIR